MYRRNLLQQLRQWKTKSNRKPLVLRGARQVGKTTLVNEFGKEFDHYIYLNMEKATDRRIFMQTDQVREVVTYLYARERIVYNKEEHTLLFIDEIQDSIPAIAMLRYFYEECPDLYVIAAGSRLQKLLTKSRKTGEDRDFRHSFPVGRVEYLNLRPFSFGEYLSASGYEMWCEQILDLSVDELLHKDIRDAFNTYALIGGMPEAVSLYIQNKDVVALRPVYKSIVTSYKDDVEDYVNSELQVKILKHVLDYGWAEAGRAITFSRFGNSNYSSSQIHEAMEILQKAFVLNLDYPVTSTAAPAVPALNRSPKLVWMDNGLVNYLADIQLEYMLNKDLLDTWRGQAAEHVVAQELRVILDRQNKENQFFWVRDKSGSSAEVDFIWQTSNHIIPIEVKNGHNSRLQSLHVFVDNSPEPVTAVRIWSEPFSVNDLFSATKKIPFRLINVPFYYVGVLDTILEKYMI